jgi:hypothetical protein
VKLLLDNRLAPLTFNWGFLDAPLDEVRRHFVRWQRLILHRVKVAPALAPLERALRQLEPLDMGSQRVLFLSTRSPWTAYFDNGLKGGNPDTVIGVLAERLRCRGVTCRAIPNTLTRRSAASPGTWGGVKFTLYAPHPTDFLNIERAVSVWNDVDGWTFEATGRMQPFEEPERYDAPRKADRFTTEMLERYCGALGISLFDPAFYGGPGVIADTAPWFLPRAHGVSLLDARRALGLPTPEPPA